MALRNTTRWFFGFFAASLAPSGLLGCGADGSSPGSSSTSDASPDGGAAQEQDPLFRSGDRLRARLLDGDSGAVRFEGFHDKKLDISCAFHRADDGKIRCLPEEKSSVEMVYLDAACTEAVALRRCGASDEYMAVEPSQTACDPDDNPYTIYHLGAIVASAPTFTKLGAIACIPSDPAPPGAELRSITAVPADLFVAAIPALEPRADGLSVRVLRADDGARETVAIHDDDLHVDCAPRHDSLGTIRCAPTLSAIAGGPFFGDAACTEPLLADVTTKVGCPAPLFAFGEPSEAMCGDMASVLRVGAKVAYPSVYQDAGGVCGQAAFLPPEWSFYEPGDAMDPAALSLLEQQKLGKGRLRTPLLSGSDQRLLAQSRGFFDTERGETCLPRSFGAEALRCVPDGAMRFDLFADAECKVRLASMPKSPGCDTPPPKVGIVPAAPPDPMCATAMVVDKVYEIAGAYTAQMVYTQSGGSCVALDPSQMALDLYTVGPEMDPTKFATVTRKTE